MIGPRSEESTIFFLYERYTATHFTEKGRQKTRTVFNIERGGGGRKECEI
jgi:hypothetical protein